MGWTRLDSTTILRHVQEMIAILKGNFYQENKKIQSTREYPIKNKEALVDVLSDQ